MHLLRRIGLRRRLKFTGRNIPARQQDQEYQARNYTAHDDLPPTANSGRKMGSKGGDAGALLRAGTARASDTDRFPKMQAKRRRHALPMIIILL
jgi:hypothetical protein